MKNINSINGINTVNTGKSPEVKMIYESPALTVLLPATLDVVTLSYKESDSGKEFDW